MGKKGRDYHRLCIRRLQSSSMSLTPYQPMRVTSPGQGGGGGVYLDDLAFCRKNDLNHPITGCREANVKCEHCSRRKSCTTAAAWVATPSSLMSGQYQTW